MKNGLSRLELQHIPSDVAHLVDSLGDSLGPAGFDEDLVAHIFFDSQTATRGLAAGERPIVDPGRDPPRIKALLEAQGQYDPCCQLLDKLNHAKVDTLYDADGPRRVEVGTKLLQLRCHESRGLALGPSYWECLLRLACNAEAELKRIRTMDDGSMKELTSEEAAQVELFKRVVLPRLQKLLVELGCIAPTFYDSCLTQTNPLPGVSAAVFLYSLCCAAIAESKIDTRYLRVDCT